MELVRFAVSAGLIAGGLVFVLSSVAGVWKFRYVLNRVHAAALGDTMGMGLILLGLIVYIGFEMTSLKLALLGLLWWLSSPVASHLIARLEITANPDLGEHMAVKTEEDPHEEVRG